MAFVARINRRAATLIQLAGGASGGEARKYSMLPVGRGAAAMESPWGAGDRYWSAIPVDAVPLNREEITEGRGLLL
jgi:hypothetical protein